MEALLIRPNIPLPQLPPIPPSFLPEATTRTITRTTLSTTEQTMTARHICPCCAGVLLRHTRVGRIYWRCSHCYQAMPV